MDMTLSDSQARGQRVKILRALANLDRKNVEERYHINFNTLKGWELARHGGLTENGAKKILMMCECEGIQCTLDWILYGIGMGPFFEKNLKPPLSTTHYDATEKKILRELMFFEENNKNTLSMKITDHDMAPFYQKNDYVAGIQCQNHEIDKLLNSPCIIKLNSKKTLILRILKKEKEEDDYYLLGYAPHCKKQHIHFSKIECISGVIWHRLPFEER
ncbi:MAG: hypothetical protein A3F17_04655 [Gammaproteobacteria bacterium RIFCSPHIGHO2_12_FULL_41_15]|nr:MAG: hypothetical protein A3F17_04655 [Gammaproteobacteria bacterium RIFCSPHIGHO2_12_FULL_41_15]